MGLPVGGKNIVLFAKPCDDLSVLPNADFVVPFKPDYDYWAGQGYRVFDKIPTGNYETAFVFATRSKEQTKDAIYAAARTARFICVDGAKTDGIESFYKLLREKVDILGRCTKAHGRLFWFESDAKVQDVLTPLSAAPQMVQGMITRAGVFSYGRVDAGSQLLYENLPQDIGGDVADFGAGWGYLSQMLLKEAPAIEAITLIEADKTALDCAQHNINDPRAKFLWADATTPQGTFDVIVMNPPFHNGRSGAPQIGQAFIRTAAQSLKKKGRLYIVANTHLPYEVVLGQCFKTVNKIAQKNGYKVFCANSAA